MTERKRRLKSARGLLFATTLVACASACIGNPPPIATGHGGAGGGGGRGGGAGGCPTAEACADNPGGPCKQGRIVCGADSRTCQDGPDAPNGTLCQTNKICVNGACTTCTAGMACATNSDPCTNGVTTCDPVGCMNGTIKTPGASCGTGQVCSAAGTCIACPPGARCATNPAAPCKLGAIACSTGAPQCLDDVNAQEGTPCGVDRVCKAGACTSCAAGTVCTTNPGGACKLGVVACGASAGCVDGANAGAGTGCGSSMVCNGNGQCVQCTAGQACTTNSGAPCKTGVVDCATGAPRCLDAGSTAAGTTCGTNLVCNGSGSCAPCTAGQACTSNPSICRNGVTSCTTGVTTCIDGTPKPSTAACTGGQLCDGAGFCGACVPNQSCTGNPSACKQGKTFCSGAMTTCTDGAVAAAGTSCGVAMVCNGSGGCLTDPTGQACTTNPNVCKTGITSYATGAPTCVDDVNKPSGTACGANTVCNGSGACVACTANANCTTNPTPCKTGISTCQTGAPVCVDFGNRSAGTACGTNQVCDGNGACGACTAGLSCTGNPSPCTNGVTSCATGAQACVDGTLKPAGTACGANEVCNANGQCGLCTSGQACTTNSHAACVNGVTSCFTGVSTCLDDSNKPAGTACGSNLVCSASGTCVACAVGSGCSGNASSCKVGIVSCATGAPICADGPGNVPAGTSCGSNQVCDGNGFCGICTPGQSCSGNPGNCYNGVASCTTGSATCVNGAAKAAGTSCGVDLVCNGVGACGSCTAGQSCTGNPSACKNGTTSCATGAMTCLDGGNKAPGTACGIGLVCNGTGACVACTAGQSCANNPSACKNGTTSCATGAQICVDGGNKPPGAICGANLVCDGNGFCRDCIVGAACTSNPSICKNGVSSCSTGAPTCFDGGDKAAGTSCGTNMVCNGSGACVACTAGGACTGNPSVCKNGATSCVTGPMTCVDGSNKMGGTSCGTNLVCDGNGNCGACTANQVCTNNPNPCYNGITSCVSGTVVCSNNSQRAAGTSCGTNMVCNTSGACVVCTAGLSCTTNPSSCKIGVVSCATGAPICVDAGNKANGSGCNDGNNCTSGDVCANGACGGTAYTCTLGQCQTSSACDGAGGCITANKPDGTGCNSGTCSCCNCVGVSLCAGGQCIASGCCNTIQCCML